MNRRDLLRMGAAAALERVPRTKVAADPQRPQCHLVAPAHRINDPNGPVWWKGKYHMFYQKSAEAGKSWGHAVSPDMLHWRNLPDALAPTPGGPDWAACASGSTVIHKGVPTILYTGFRPECQCVATSDDEMVVWRKHPGNPIVPGPPKGMAVIPRTSSAAPEAFPEGAIGITGFRDPRVWQENGTWYMIVGSGFPHRGGAALLYRSRDLMSWEYLHPLCIGLRNPLAWGPRVHDTGEVWECPDFFPLGGKHVLVVSTTLRNLYFVGRYEGLRFYPEVAGCLDYGAFYAAQSQLDERGRRILWGWIRETRGGTAQARAGWGGAISLPRVPSLSPEGTLRFDLAPGVEALRGRRVSVKPGAILPGGPRPVPSITGDCLEIEAEIDPGNAPECGIAIRRSPGAEEETRILYRPADRVLTVDLTRSSQAPENAPAPHEGPGALVRRAPLELPPGEPLRLRIVLDGSVAEIFANGRACVTARIYAVRPDAQGVALVASGAGARLLRLESWDLRPISPDRLTS